MTIDNPTTYPDPARIAKQEEPFVDAHIYTPNDYVGQPDGAVPAADAASCST